jgi:hypothetical protein
VRIITHIGTLLLSNGATQQRAHHHYHDHGIDIEVQSATPGFIEAEGLEIST